MGTYSEVRIDNHVMIVTINRPQVRNALNIPAHQELASIFDKFEADPALRVAIITGTGDEAFCAGSDIKEELDRGAKPETGFAGITRRFDMRKPVIAAVNGVAAGGGLEILSGCDLAVAADHARFGLPEPRVGLAAIDGGLQRLVRQLPLKFAMEILLTGELIDAPTALRYGLINACVPRDRLMDTALAYANAIVRCAPLAVSATKALAMAAQTLPDQRDRRLWTHPDVERMWYSDDAQEGLRAFAEKRLPQWRGQ
jgi:enoyl-CoA hydratase/carnithine racemase